MFNYNVQIEKLLSRYQDLMSAIGGLSFDISRQSWLYTSHLYHATRYISTDIVLLTSLKVAHFNVISRPKAIFFQTILFYISERTVALKLNEIYWSYAYGDQPCFSMALNVKVSRLMVLYRRIRPFCNDTNLLSNGVFEERKLCVECTSFLQ